MPTVPEVVKRLGWLKTQDDVLELAREEGIKCSRKCAREIIDGIDWEHDVGAGISWDTVRDYLVWICGNSIPVLFSRWERVG